MNQHPFDQLTPDFIIDAVEAQDYWCDGRLLALNSYENRVYQVGIEDQDPVIVKFYRPQRWSRQQILEEHQLCFELAEHELPVVTPLVNGSGSSLNQAGDFNLALFQRRGGHAPELDYQDNLTILGRLLARMHRIGAQSDYVTRPAINLQDYAIDSIELIREHFIPTELERAYSTLCDDIVAQLTKQQEQINSARWIRVHGDCHAGNMLWRGDAPHFVDFDDSRMAPAIQDIWMLLSGEHENQQIQLKRIVDGYLEFHDFDFRELDLIEVFRTLRILYYAAWLARRWDDPAFPRSFPWFNTPRYWEEHILELREQLAALQQPPLRPAP